MQFPFSNSSNLNIYKFYKLQIPPDCSINVWITLSISTRSISINSINKSYSIMYDLTKVKYVQVYNYNQQVLHIVAKYRKRTITYHLRITATKTSTNKWNLLQAKQSSKFTIQAQSPPYSIIQKKSFINFWIFKFNHLQAWQTTDPSINHIYGIWQTPSSKATYIFI